MRPPDHLGAELADLARQVRRLAPPSRLDPERFHLERDEIASRLGRLARNGMLPTSVRPPLRPRPMPPPPVRVVERIRVVVVKVPARLLHPPGRHRFPLPKPGPDQARLALEGSP